jgi:hypothetical protein
VLHLFAARAEKERMLMLIQLAAAAFVIFAWLKKPRSFLASLAGLVGAFYVA